MASIRKRGTRWQVQIRRKGEGLLSRSFPSRKAAETWARAIEAEADRKGLPPNRKVLDSLSLADLAQRYRDEVSIHKRGAATEKIVLNAFLRHPICKKHLSSLGPDDFARYREERLAKVKPITLKRQLATIHHLFEIARTEWGLPLQGNPVTKATLSARDEKRQRRLLEGELSRLLDAAGQCLNPYVLPIIRLGVETGMRRSELLGIKWEHIDLANRTLLIPDSKNGHARLIPLTRQAAKVLQSVPKAEQSIFPLTANAFRLAWERTKKRAKVQDLRFHDLRHEAVSRFFELGLSTPEVALISGHKDLRMLFRYAHPLQKQILAKMDAERQHQLFVEN